MTEKADEPPECDGCGEPKEFVDEPVVSGFRGYVCTTDDCNYDS